MWTWEGSALSVHMWLPCPLLSSSACTRPLSSATLPIASCAMFALRGVALPYLCVASSLLCHDPPLLSHTAPVLSRPPDTCLLHAIVCVVCLVCELCNRYVFAGFFVCLLCVCVFLCAYACSGLGFMVPMFVFVCVCYVWLLSMPVRPGCGVVWLAFSG